MRAVLLEAGLVGMSLVCVSAGVASDWPQYRGMAGAAVTQETLQWPKGGPKQLWATDTPTGFSSFAVSQGKTYTLVARTVEGAPLTLCLALDAATGKELWATPTGVAKFPSGGDRGAEGNSGGDGPRSTPAANGDRVYVYSADMLLYCLDATTGREVWKKDIAKEFGGRNIGWKSALSPLIEGDLVCVAGGARANRCWLLSRRTGSSPGNPAMRP